MKFKIMFIKVAHELGKIDEYMRNSTETENIRTYQIEVTVLKNTVTEQ